MSQALWKFGEIGTLGLEWSCGNVELSFIMYWDRAAMQMQIRTPHVASVVAARLPRKIAVARNQLTGTPCAMALRRQRPFG
jgi:hypothetical protein